MATDLKSIQQQFAAAISAKDPHALADLISAPPTTTTASRLAIYAKGHHGALAKALEETFPVIKRLVGDDFFTQLVTLYIEQNPSSEPDLNLYGKNFPKIIQKLIDSKPELKTFTYFPYVAELEAAHQSAYYAPDDPSFDFLGFQKLLGESSLEDSIVFVPTASLSLIESPYKILNIWENNRTATDPQEIVLENTTEHLAVWRKNDKVVAEAIDRPTYLLLEKVKLGKSLLELVESVESGVGAPLPMVMFLERGWIVAWQLRT